MITARIIGHSKNPLGNELVSFLVKYPRFIHGELMTHRAFSRNAASSRAIPLRKMLDAVLEEPAMAERWPAEQRGMQGGEDLNASERLRTLNVWMSCRDYAAAAASECGGLGLHKGHANRLIEPWAHITVLITTAYPGLANFFALRAHPAAQPEFQVLAYRMLQAYLDNKPQALDWCQWHIPEFTGVNTGDNPDLMIEGMDHIKVATARCARLSYLTFDGQHDPGKDIALHDQLLSAGHMSPFEHCAQAKLSYDRRLRSNFDFGKSPSGWIQYRKTIEGECKELDKDELFGLMANRPAWITT